jgi:hypothetical protein
MATRLERVQKLQQRRADLMRSLLEAGDLRPGSLVARYRRCGRPQCHCAATGSAGHGPSWSLTREVRGKTITRVIPATAVARTRAQLEEYHRFRDLVRELIDTSEQLCEAQLAAEALSEEGAEKRGSARRSPSRSGRKSRRS